MPVYTYRREDGTTFEIRQRFLDDPLEVDPSTGQKVVRLIQAPGIIFKGSGFYVNDSKKAHNGNLGGGKAKENGSSGESKTESKSESTTETKTKSEVKESAAD